MRLRSAARKTSLKKARRKPLALRGGGRVMKKRRRSPDEIGISDHSPSGDHGKRPGHQGKPEHAGLPGGAGRDQDRDPASGAVNFQGEGVVRAHRNLSGKRAPPGKVCRLPSRLEKSLRAVKVRRKNAGVRAKLVG